VKVFVSSIYISQNQMYQTTKTLHTIYKHDLWKEEDCPALVLYVTSPIAMSDDR